MITFVTGNEKKWKEIQEIIGSKVALQRASIDLPELQGSIDAIAKEKCKIAAKQLGTAVLVEDTALCFNAMGELPGPYIKWFLEELGHEGLNRMLSGWEDKSAQAICTIAYAESPEAEHPIPRHYTCIKGPSNFGWDPIFQPDHPSGHTYAEMDSAIKNSLSHRSRALEKLQAFFNSGV